MSDDAPIRPLEASEYDPTDEEKWQALEARMNLYFAQSFDMFPEVPGLTPLHLFSGLYKRNIETWFPDDADLRKKVAGLRRKLNAWFRYYVVFGKRALLAIFLTLTLMLLDPGSSPLTTLAKHNDVLGIIAAYQTADGLWVRLAVALVVFIIVQSSIWKIYRDGVVNICTKVSSDIQKRTVDLVKIYNGIPLQIRKNELHFEDINRCALLSARYVQEMQWLAKRDEYTMKYIQVEAWSINQNRRIWDFIGIAILAGIFLCFAHAVWVTPASLQTKFLVASIWGAVSLLTYVRWITPRRVLEAYLQPGRWITFHEFQLHRTLGAVVEAEQRQARIYRDQNKNKP